MKESKSTEEYSMEDYFQEEQEQPKGSEKKRKGKEKQTPSGKRQKRAARGKKFLMILCAVILLVLILWLVIYRVIRNNDGERFAQKLSGQIGTPLSQAAKKADVSLKNSSDYLALNEALQGTEELQIAESGNRCTVGGVHFPEWVIQCGLDGEALQTVTYYDFEVLEDDLFGTRRKAYIDPNLLTKSASVEDTEKSLGLSPYCIRYLSDSTQERIYRYRYKDGDTSDMASYTITLQFDENGNLSSCSDSRMNYLSGLLFHEGSAS